MQKEFSELLLQSKAREPKLDNWPPVRLSNQFTPSNSEFLANCASVPFDLRSEFLPSLLTLKKNGLKSPSLQSLVQKAKHALSQWNPENLSLVSNKESFDFRNPLRFRKEEVNRGIHLQPSLPKMFRSEDEQLDEPKTPNKFLVLGSRNQDRVQLKRGERLAKNVVLSNRSISNGDADNKNKLVDSYFLAKKDSFKKLRKQKDSARKLSPRTQSKDIQIEHWTEFQRHRKQKLKDESTSPGPNCSSQNQSNQENQSNRQNRAIVPKLYNRVGENCVEDFEIKRKQMDSENEKRSMLSAETTNYFTRKCLKLTIEANSGLREKKKKGKSMAKLNKTKNLKFKKSKNFPTKSIFFRKLVRRNPLFAMKKRFSQENDSISKLCMSQKIQKKKAKKLLKKKLVQKTSFLEESKLKPKTKNQDSSIERFMQFMIDFCLNMENRLKTSLKKRISSEQLLESLNSNLKKHGKESFISQIMFCLSLCGKMSDFYTKNDLARIRQIYELSLNLIKNYSSNSAFYIDPQTNEIYAKNSRSTQSENKSISFKSDSAKQTKKLVPMRKYIQKYPDLVHLFNCESSHDAFLKINHVLSSEKRKLEPIQQAPPRKQPKASKRIQKKRQRRTKGCNCSKSKCLRLHCVCFRNGSFCNEKCGCKGCYNSEKFGDLVEKVRMTTKDINSCAFRERIIEVEMEGKKQKFTHGCSCSKNGCLKNYCECRKNDLPCSSLCKCEGCLNCKVTLDPRLANELYKKPARKKKKIIFKPKNADSLEMVEETLRSSLRH